MANDDNNFLRYLQGSVQTFNPYGAGQKLYGSGRSAPNIGPTNSPEGYYTRDRKAKARRNAMLRKMKADQSGRRMNPDWLRRRNYSG